MSNEIMNRPKEIIEFCLKPLNLDAKSEAYKLAYARLNHVIATYQKEILKQNRPVAVDFGEMKTLTINEAAHGDD